MNSREQSQSASMGDEIALRFLFANYDNCNVQLRFHKSTRVAQVKEELKRHWPTNIPAADELEIIRLICMGRGILHDARTLEECGVPTFETHPTPVNVAILRKSPTKPDGTNRYETQGPKPVPASGCGCTIV